jgi:signal transduction histidine kinase
MDLNQSQPNDAAHEAAFEEIFQKETRTLLGSRFRLSFSIGIVLYLLFSALDWFFAHDQWATFLSLRIGVASLAAIAMLSSATRWGERNVVFLSFFTLSLASFVLSMMTSMLDGFSSRYFYGNMLVLFLVGLFMPWRPGVTLTFCFVVTCGYFCSNLWVHELELVAVLPFFFLMGTCALTTMGSMAAEHSRRKDLYQRLALEKANEQLQELDQAKTNFFANVSHELRTPLMLILGPLESLLSGRDSSNPRPLLESMNTSANRLLRQVNMILNFAKLEAGHQKCTFETANVGEILRNLLKGLEPFAEAHAMRVEYSGLDELPNSIFDKEKIETIFSNLISNAMKFTPDGGRLSVRAGSEGKGLWVEVEDTGRGIPLNQQAKVFERFHQVPESGKDAKIQGTGLGLSLSREFARLHDGDLTLKSRPDAGSTFRLEIPLEPAGAYQDKVSESRSSGFDSETKKEKLQFGSTTGAARTSFADLAQSSFGDSDSSSTSDADPNAALVLVVEDNVDMLAFISRSLRHKYRVETAQDGMEGLEKARRMRPDLIVSDVMMPRLDGLGMLRRIRESSSLMRTPVIMVTARTGAEAVVHGLELGAVDYVTKPFRLSELEARIEAQLRMMRVQNEMDEQESRLVAMGQMAGSLAHDLRSPLTSLGLRVEVLQMTAESKGFDGAVGEDLNVMKRSLNRASAMVANLMEFLQGQDVHLDLQSISVEKFLKDVAADMKPAFDAVNIQMEVEVQEAERLLVAIDRERLGRVMQNLLNNALEAMTEFQDAKGDLVRIEASAVRDSLLVRVADNGPGIPEEIFETLFQPFTTVGKAKGTGLGLAIVQNLVDAHGGTIRAEENPPEGGAAFRIELPRNQSFWEELAADLPEN